MKTWVNGIETDQISLQDRGLAYGDGFFTTLLAKGTTPIHWSAHWARLALSAKRLGFPPLNEATLWTQLKTALAGSVGSHNAQHDLSVMKIIITRGQGGQGYLPPSLENTQPNIIFQHLPFPGQFSAKNAQAWPEFQLKLGWSEIVLGHQTSVLVGLKHLNRLENVLARQRMPTDCDDVLMIDEEGWVISSTQANLVLLKQKVLYTPDLSRAGVKGTFLTALLNHATDFGYEVKITPLNRADVCQADEIWLCNAVRGLMPVMQLEQQSFTIEQGQRMNQIIQTRLWEATQCKN